jgi:hypothetical protein
MLRVTEDLIDQVYEAAAVPELWDGVLDRVARQFGSIGGLLFTHNSQYDAWAGSSVGIACWSSWRLRRLHFPTTPATGTLVAFLQTLTDGFSPAQRR